MKQEKHLLRPEEFTRVKALTRMARASLTIAERVLVHGEQQAAVARKYKKSRQHVSEIVKVFWEHYATSHTLPDGWKVETVALPVAVWPKVREIEARAKRSLTRPEKSRQKIPAG